MYNIQKVIEIKNTWDCIQCIPENKEAILSIVHCKVWDITDLVFKNDICYFITEDWPEGLYEAKVGNYLLFDDSENWDQDGPNQITPEVYKLFYHVVDERNCVYLTPYFAEKLKKEFDRVYFEEYNGE